MTDVLVGKKAGLLFLRKLQKTTDQETCTGTYFAALFQQAPWPQAALDNQGIVVACNDMALKLLQIADTEEKAAGAETASRQDTDENKVCFYDWFAETERDVVLAWHQRILREKKAQNIDTTIRREAKLVRLVGQPVFEHDLVQVTVQDLSGTAQNGEALIQMAYYDQLTGLPNRYLLLDRLHWAISDASRHHEHMAIIALDLDFFKKINDAFGHQAGDHLLQMISRRMATCLRDSDTLARVGGDEFIVFMQHVADSQDAVLVAERLLAAIQNPVEIKGVTQTVSASIGICLYPQDGRRAEELLEKSDIALYRAKSNGKNQYAFFNETMKLAADTRIDFERRLRQACANNELTVYYQPIIAAAGRKIIALEALVRWNSREDGCLPAAAFLPVAESIGADRQITEWALQSAFGQMKKWLDSGLIDAADPCRLTVNISNRQLHAPELVDQISRLLADSGLPPERLVLEIRESALNEQATPVRENLARLREMSLQLYLDDFCQGFCSMNQIGQIPVTSVKIDQNLTAALSRTDHGQLLLSSMIRLSHLMNLHIIAEGVETQDAETLLIRYGCDALQGYWISRPLPAVQTELLLMLNR